MAVFSALTVLALGSFGVTRFGELPFHRWTVAWSKWTVASWKRCFPFVLVVVLLGLGLHDAVGLFHCQYERKAFLDRLSDGWTNRHDTKGPELIGRAHALYPNRPEPYFIYQSARRSLAEQSNEERGDDLKEYARAFLDGHEADNSLRWCPILFCCSCVPKSYFRLMPRIAMAESHDHSRATKHKPDKDDADAYLLWLYHMSEREDIDDDEYERLYLKLMKAANADEWKNSPVYPGVVDHVMQAEYLIAMYSSDECPAETMWKYTEIILHRYKSTGDMSPVVPPNKTQVYSILKQISLNPNTGDPDSGREVGTPFPDLREGVKKLLNDCPDYRRKFDEHYTESEVTGKRRLPACPRPSRGCGMAWGVFSTGKS